MIGEVILQAASRPYWFVRRQEWNFKVVMTRRALSAFLQQLVQQYGSIYIVALGAGPVGLGTINSLGTGIGALVAVPIGWLADRHSPKGIFVFGSALLVFAPLLYATAPNWKFIIAAMLVSSVAWRFLHTGCQIVCASSLKDSDRATGKNVCGALAAIASLLGLAVAPFLVTAFGGLNVTGIRPLYYIQFLGYLAALILIITQLGDKEVHEASGTSSRSGFLRDVIEVFQHGAVLKRWVLVSALAQMSMHLIGPFTQLFAYEVKGADQYVLAGMATASTVVGLVVGVPLGRLADRIGRKKVLYLVAPLYYAANIMLIVAPSPAVLLASGALRGFSMASFLISGAMTAEMVPVADMGKWTGILTLFGGLVSVPAPIIGGLMWKSLGPASLFLAAIGIDVLLRIPLLATVPETLGGEGGE